MNTIESLKDAIHACTDMIKEDGIYLGCGIEITDKYYLHPSSALKSLALQAYFMASSKVQQQIECLGSFVTGRLSADDAEYEKSIARIVVAECGGGYAIYKIVLSELNAFKSKIDNSIDLD